MDNKLENNEWMNEAPFLAKLPRTNPFSTPPGYFEGLQENINASVYLDRLKDQAGPMSLQVPEGYFEEFKDRIYSRIAEEELKDLVQEGGFAVPEGYFENLNSRIMAQVAEPALVVKKNTPVFKLWHSNAMKYSTAACIVIISAIGLYLNEPPTTTVASKTVQVQKASKEDQALYDIDEQVIIEEMPTGSTQQTANTTATQTEMEDYILNNYSQNDISSNL
jgi:hypothetical protein